MRVSLEAFHTVWGQMTQEEKRAVEHKARWECMSLTAVFHEWPSLIPARLKGEAHAIYPDRRASGTRGTRERGGRTMTREMQYQSGVCHVCRADLTLTEMREHNYLCTACHREVRGAEDDDGGYYR